MTYSAAFIIIIRLSLQLSGTAYNVGKVVSFASCVYRKHYSTIVISLAIIDIESICRQSRESLDKTPVFPRNSPPFSAQGQARARGSQSDQISPVTAVRKRTNSSVLQFTRKA